MPVVGEDGWVRLWPDFLSPAEADECCEALLRELAWRCEHIRMGARTVQVPRLVCWYGDAGAVYRYSGVDHRPQPWTPRLAMLRRRVESGCGLRFNGVLGNLYRDGRDHLGWHADDEPELGPEPAIASLSLGATRRFRLRHTATGQTRSLDLPSGSLLLMGGVLQRHWKHCLCRTARPVAARINLSFRHVIAA